MGFVPDETRAMLLDAVWVAIMQRKVSWVLDADIHSFFRFNLA